MPQLWYAPAGRDPNPRLVLDADGSVVRTTHIDMALGRPAPVRGAVNLGTVDRLTVLADRMGVTKSGEAFALEKGIAPTADALEALVDDGKYRIAAPPSRRAGMASPA